MRRIKTLPRRVRLHSGSNELHHHNTIYDAMWVAEEEKEEEKQEEELWPDCPMVKALDTRWYMLNNLTLTPRSYPKVERESTTSLKLYDNPGNIFMCDNGINELGNGLMPWIASK